MNIQFLRTLLLEETRLLYDADVQVCGLLPKMMRAVLCPEVREVIRQRLEMEQGQIGEMRTIFARLQASPEGGQSHAMRGLLEEAREAIHREPRELQPVSRPELLGTGDPRGNLDDEQGWPARGVAWARIGLAGRRFVRRRHEASPGVEPKLR